MRVRPAVAKTQTRLEAPIWFPGAAAGRTALVMKRLLFVLMLIACGSTDAGREDAAEPAAPASIENAFVVQLGDDVAPAVRDRVRGLIATLRPDAQMIEADRDLGVYGAGTRIIAVGKTTAAAALVRDEAVADLKPEGFVLASGAIGRAHALVARGRPQEASRLAHGDIGNAFAAYAILEDLGIGFLHPLAPAIPKTAHIPEASSFVRREEPRWPVRGIQIHTMHPLELTNLLQGWGETGPDDAAGFERMLPEWDRFLEWMLANRQNRMHWVLLEASSWSAFATSDLRRSRLARLVTRAHEHGIAVGVDVPIAQIQQHVFRLIEGDGPLEQQLAGMRRRLDWVLSAGFDYISTNNGTTEFTHSDPARMIAWMNELARHVAEAHAGKRSYVKIHCSTGQTAPGYPDPVTGQPINVNFLPHFTDARLGIMPHTVQHYGLDDPAPTYGNQDFGYMHDFLRHEAGRREVLWHPETAYWVSFDIDVPLFLPLYADRRVHDLRILATDEDAKRMGLGAHAGARMDGQVTFSSGWEWGYWLNDVVTARAAWSPDDLATVLDRALGTFGPSAATVRDLVVETSAVQHALLVRGRAFGKTPASIERRNGQAYLQGTETWDDVSDLGSSIPGIDAAQMTQPDKLGLVEMRSPVPTGAPRYTGDVEPLLADMEQSFAKLDAKWSAARAAIPEHARDLFDDLADAMHMTSLRARQVHGLYDYVDRRDEPAGRWRLAAARAALDEAVLVVRAREPRYRVPAARIAGWGSNPTAYEFGYLWTVRSLYYWWRDEGKAVDAPRSPCYLNVLSMADVGLGEGALANGTAMLRAVLDRPGNAECLSVPPAEPTYPRDGLRSRP